LCTQLWLHKPALKGASMEKLMITNLALQLTDAEYERNFADINPPFVPSNAKVEANRCLF
jgi:hypothetical protein